MSTPSDWEIPQHAQPKQEDWGFDLDRTLASVVTLRATIPADAFTAGTLGTERAGNGVLMRDDGLVLTIGYLITEADSIWINTNDGRALPGHALAYDQETGFGLVQALGRVNLPPLPLGRSSRVRVGERVVVAGGGGRMRAISARVAAKQEFAGYWEYLLDEAIFTSPAHPNWGGAALITGEGLLAGIGSLHLQQGRDNGPPEHLNMIVPIDLLPPILDDLTSYGRPNHAPRPWLGLYATEVEDKIVVAGLANNGPARRGGLRMGDVVLAVGGDEISDLASLYRRIWSCGPAGARVPMLVYRDGRTLSIDVRSADRTSFLKAPSVH
ncbi:MAG TPA: S1C family serine protease [Stellaceae bacterium]|nr:S1C family serine protease [Stellaceae bacterium]